MPRTRSVAWSELKLGLLGIGTLALVSLMVVAVGGQGGFFWERYPLKMQFADARGLKAGALVRLSGKDIGTVTSVEFAGGRIEVAILLSKRVRSAVTTDSVGTIGSLSLLGEPIVDLRAASTGTPLADWAYVPTAETRLTDLTSSASASLSTAGELLAGLRAGQGTLGRLLTDEALYQDLSAFVAAASSVTRALGSGRGTIPSLLNDPSAYRSLKTALDELQVVTSRMTNPASPLGRLLGDEAMGRSLAGTLEGLDAAGARLGRGDNTLGRLLTERELYDRLQTMTARVDQVVAGLDEGRGSAGQLLRDRELYDNMNRAASELRALLSDIRKDPKKYLRVSVSIF
jgi:phospholipid/cholesterol/gamma-HCH transport system substrate-binding protein